MKRRILKILKITGLVLVILIAVFFAVRAVGVSINRRTPEGGINESMYVDINGTKQWINIYGEDINNPVLLYLHGGPGSSTSEFDYVFTRKWADVYTVVTWDQRNCGKSYDKSQNGTALTKDILMTDGREMTEFIREYMSADKITLLGHSWGSIYGANLALEYPQYYDRFIGTGQLVDMYDNEKAFIEEALSWAAGNEEDTKLLKQCDPKALTMEYLQIRNTVMNKYGYGMMKDGTDYSLPAAVIFNPNYSLADWINYFSRDMGVYTDFMLSGGLDDFSLKGRYDYSIPYYNINGDMDYQTNHEIAQEYFDSVNAPYKEMIVMENTTHGLLESRTEEFSEILHGIAAEEQ